ncbi:MAG TPA: FtsW/RodA/SpoVE family cell cycle protein [Ktedonobacterales bacterium]|jgi:cell division protein FtsW (lipid II flippase)
MASRRTIDLGRARRNFGALMDGHRYRWTELWLLLLPAAFMTISVLELEIIRTAPQVINRQTLPPLYAFAPALGLMAALIVAHLALNIFAPDADQTLLPIVGTLASIGVIMATRLGRDISGQQDLGAKQLAFVVVGLIVCVLTVRFTRSLGWLRNYKYTWAFAGLILVGITLFRAISSFNTNAPNRDVLSIGLGTGGLSFQPSELLKICLVIFFAGYLSENQEMLALARFKVGPFALPPLKHLGPLLVMLGVAMLMIIGVRELGLALLIFGLFLSMLYVASNRPMYVVTSLILFAIGAIAAFGIFTYARTRLDIMGSAFDPAVEPNQGYQIVQGLISFASGGVFGSGLGLGSPTITPAATTDYIAAAFGEEFGFAGVLALIGLFLLLVYRGLSIAAQARDPFNKLMAVGLTAVFALQTLVILAGNLKVMPLTGVPLPFVAYGGSSVIANFIIIGLLLRLSENDT